MTARTWEVGDPVVECVDGTCHVGTVACVGDRLIGIRFDGGGRAAFRHPANPHLVPGGELLRAAALLNPAPQPATAGDR